MKTNPTPPLLRTLMLLSAIATTSAVEPANPESRPLTPDARRSRDSSKLADPDATKVIDGSDDKANPNSRETSSAERLRNADLPDGELPTPPADETEAETAVRKAAEDALRIADERKLQLQGQGDAGALIQEILGSASALSRAELARAGQSEARRVIRAERKPAVDFLKRRLRGEADLSEAPSFFRQADDAGPLYEGRRFLHVDSSDAIPAILLANARLERLKVQTAEEAKANDGMPLPPPQYQGTAARFVSYPIQEGSMFISRDLRFIEGSTQFADGHSFDMVFAVADAMKDSELAGSNFLVEVHVSGPDTPDENRELAQSRAEAVARELVRAGVSPLNVIPVGFEETGAESAVTRRTSMIIARLAEPALPEVPAE
jgi:outer membrane protein OmpA-like peptidoglycan-associated protein